MQVTRMQYDRCYIDALNYDDVAMIVNCSDPRQRRRYTILFEPFQSIPNAPEYMPGRSYYYLSTWCKQHNVSVVWSFTVGQICTRSIDTLDIWANSEMLTWGGPELPENFDPLLSEFCPKWPKSGENIAKYLQNYI